VIIWISIGCWLDCEMWLLHLKKMKSSTWPGKSQVFKTTNYE